MDRLLSAVWTDVIKMAFNLRMISWLATETMVCNVVACYMQPIFNHTVRDVQKNAQSLILNGIQSKSQIRL